MTVDTLTQRIDTTGGRIIDLRHRFRRIDPGDHGEPAASVPPRHTLPDERLTGASDFPARRMALAGQQDVPSPADDAAGPRQLARHSAGPDPCRYRSLFDSAIDAMLLFGPDRRLAEANPAAHALLGYARDETVQLRLDDLVACDAHQLDAIMASLQCDGAWRDELEARRKDGTTVPVDVAMTAVTGATGIAFWATLRDVTDRRRQQAEAERARHDIVAMVGHELISPLNAILLHAEILKMTRSHRETSVDAVIASVHQERRLIEDLLELARTDTGRLTLRPSRVDPIELLRSCIAAYQPMVRKHVLRIHAPDQMPAGQWDRARLEQVFQNLLSNALKYSPDGGEVRVYLEDLGDRARLSVADHGVGIADDALPYVFDRFFRANTAEDGPRGLGLGLYIANVLVEAHGGTISVASVVGRGSVFHVSLPYGFVGNYGEMFADVGRR